MKTDNEWIAEFMGGHKQVVTDKKEGGYKEGTVLWHDLFGEQGAVTYLDFDTSWDWLMPVVEKIEQHGCIIEISLCLGRSCRIQKVLTKTTNWHTAYESNSMIECVYKCVVEYIKWYNSKPTPDGK